MAEETNDPNAGTILADPNKVDQFPGTPFSRDPHAGTIWGNKTSNEPTKNDQGEEGK